MEFLAELLVIALGVTKEVALEMIIQHGIDFIISIIDYYFG